MSASIAILKIFDLSVAKKNYQPILMSLIFHTNISILTNTQKMQPTTVITGIGCSFGLWKHYVIHKKKEHVFI